MIFNTYIKKLAAVALSLTVVVSAAILPVYAEEQTGYVMSETTKTTQQLLKMLDVIKSNDSVKAEEDVTRGYFAAMLGRVMKLPNDGTEVRTMFRDVTEDYKWAGEIAGMYKMGYISGGEDRKFRPDDKITLQEAVTMGVNCLGFSESARIHGGFPMGYLYEASRLKLYSGSSNRETITYDDALEIIMNILESEMLVPNGVVTGGQIEYKTEENLLSSVHNVYTVEGIVAENGLTGLYKNSAKRNSILIGDMYVQNPSGYDLKNLLGMRITAYCKDNDGEYEYMMLKESSKNDVYEFNGWDNEPKYDRAKNSITYYYGNKEKTLKLSNDFKFIYNGMLEDNYLNYVSDLSESVIRAIDNDQNGYYDVLVVETYNTFIAGDANDFSGRIVSKYNGFDAIETGEYTTVEFTDAQGKEVTTSSVSSGDVLSYYTSVDGTYLKIVKSSSVVTGEITAMSQQDNEYTIAETTYKAAPTVTKGAVTLKLKKKGTFGIDMFGRIAEFTEDFDESCGYGLMIKYSEDTDSGDGTCYVKIMNQLEEFQTYTVAEKVKINDKVYSRAKHEQYAIINSLASQNDANGTRKEDLIIFATDENGNVSEMKFAPATTPQKSEITDGKFYMYKERKIRMYKLDTGNMGDDFYINKSSTLVFGIDENMSYGDENRYFTMSAGSFDNDQNVSAEAYTTKEEPETAEALLYFGSKNSGGTVFYPISALSKAINDDDKIIYIAKGVSSEVKLTAELVEKYSITAGDIIGDTETKTNSDGEIYETDLLYDYSERKMNPPRGNNFWNDRAYILYPYSYSGNVIKWYKTTDKEKADEFYRNGNISENDLCCTLAPSIIVAEKGTSGDVYRTGSMSDITSYVQNPDEYSDVIVRSKWGIITDVVVIQR